MAAVTIDEIRPGLVVYIDTDQLRQAGGSQTNAEKVGVQDRAVIGPHQFLVLEVDAQTGSCLAVPLFSNAAKGNIELDRVKMGGTTAQWRNGTYNYSRWQHWRIPLDRFAAASGNELSNPGDRCTYAIDDPTELSKIAAWQKGNRAGWRSL